MEEKIRDFIQRKILHGKRLIGPTESLFGKGVIDSIGHLQLITFLEREFGISFSMEEFTWENFDSIQQICFLVQKKSQAKRS